MLYNVYRVYLMLCIILCVCLCVNNNLYTVYYSNLQAVYALLELRCVHKYIMYIKICDIVIVYI